MVPAITDNNKSISFIDNIDIHVNNSPYLLTDQETKIMEEINHRRNEERQQSQSQQQQQQQQQGLTRKMSRVEDKKAKLKLADKYLEQAYDLLWNLGEDEMALEVINKALTIQESVLGRDHKETGWTYNFIGAIYWIQEEFESALDAYIMAKRIFSRTCLKGGKITLSISERISILLEDEGFSEKQIDDFHAWLNQALRHEDLAVHFDKYGDAVRSSYEQQEANKILSKISAWTTKRHRNSIPTRTQSAPPTSAYWTINTSSPATSSSLSSSSRAQSVMPSSIQSTSNKEFKVDGGYDFDEETNSSNVEPDVNNNSVADNEYTSGDGVVAFAKRDNRANHVVDNIDDVDTATSNENVDSTTTEMARPVSARTIDSGLDTISICRDKPFIPSSMVSSSSSSSSSSRTPSLNSASSYSSYCSVDSSSVS